VSPNFMNQRQVGETVFIPEDYRVMDPDILDNTATSDSIIFDKAEEAESIEKRKALLTDVQEKIAAEREQLKQAKGEEAKDVIQKKLDSTIALRDKLEEKIDEKVEKLSDS